MSNVRYPTYLLAPNWTFRPGGRIVIGNVIVDPFIPHRAIVTPNAETPLSLDVATEKNWHLSIETIKSLSLSVWAVFLEKISLKVGTSRTYVKNKQFSMDSLETQSLKDDPSDEYIQELCKNPVVREYMRLDGLLCKPIYIITGLKVAKGFRMSGSDSRSSGITTEASGEVVPEVSLGAGAEGSSFTSISDQFESESDIIFAYQLLMLKPKGWTKDKKIATSDFRKQALLSDEKDEVDGEAEAVKDALEPKELEESNGGFQLVESKYDEFEAVSVLYKEA